MSVWDGVVVSPLERAYEKSEDTKDGEEDDFDGGGEKESEEHEESE